MDYLDMLAVLGVGNAHPGGFAETLRQLERHPLPPGARVLEVGCGTGRTACYLASLGYEVTGLDIRPGMIAKARARAAKEGLERVDFQVGDACALPFPDGAFDVVMVESVTIFTDSARAFSEYARVLRPGGRLFDREMVGIAPLDADRYAELTGFYKLPKLPDAGGWSALLAGAGLSGYELEGPNAFPMVNEDLLAHPDPHQEIDPGSFLNADLWETSRRYNELMEENAPYIGYVLMVGTK